MSPLDRVPDDDDEAKVLEDVKTYGWHVVNDRVERVLRGLEGEAAIARFTKTARTLGS